MRITRRQLAYIIRENLENDIADDGDIGMQDSESSPSAEKPEDPIASVAQELENYPEFDTSTGVPNESDESKIEVDQRAVDRFKEVVEVVEKLYNFYKKGADDYAASIDRDNKEYGSGKRMAGDPFFVAIRDLRRIILIRMNRIKAGYNDRPKNEINMSIGRVLGKRLNKIKQFAIETLSLFSHATGLAKIWQSFKDKVLTETRFPNNQFENVSKDFEAAKEVFLTKIKRILFNLEMFDAEAWSEKNLKNYINASLDPEHPRAQTGFAAGATTQMSVKKKSNETKKGVEAKIKLEKIFKYFFGEIKNSKSIDKLIAAIEDINVLLRRLESEYSYTGTIGLQARDVSLMYHRWMIAFISDFTDLSENFVDTVTSEKESGKATEIDDKKELIQSIHVGIYDLIESLDDMLIILRDPVFKNIYVRDIEELISDMKTVTVRHIGNVEINGFILPDELVVSSDY